MEENRIDEIIISMAPSFEVYSKRPEDERMLKAWDRVRVMIFDYCHENAVNLSGIQLTDAERKVYEQESENHPKTNTNSDEFKIRWVTEKSKKMPIQIFDKIPDYFYSYENERKDEWVSDNNWDDDPVFEDVFDPKKYHKRIAFEEEFFSLFPNEDVIRGGNRLSGKEVLLNNINTAIEQRERFKSMLRSEYNVSSGDFEKIICRIEEIINSDEMQSNYNNTYLNGYIYLHEDEGKATLYEKAKVLEPFIGNRGKIADLNNLREIAEKRQRNGMWDSFSQWIQRETGKAKDEALQRSTQSRQKNDVSHEKGGN